MQHNSIRADGRVVWWRRRASEEAEVEEAPLAEDGTMGRNRSASF